MRSGEAWNLEWIDVDFDDKLVKISPEKGRSLELIKICDKHILILNTLSKNNPKIFRGPLRHLPDRLDGKGLE